MEWYIRYFLLFCIFYAQNERIYNTRLKKTEQCSKLFHATADETEEIKEVTQGNIAVVAGLKVGRIFVRSKHV